jgi:hypothetical protein
LSIRAGIRAFVVKKERTQIYNLIRIKALEALAIVNLPISAIVQRSTACLIRHKQSAVGVSPSGSFLTLIASCSALLGPFSGVRLLAFWCAFFLLPRVRTILKERTYAVF